MNSLRYLVSPSTENEHAPGALDEKRRQKVTYVGDPELGITLWIWQWVVYFFPFLVAFAPAELKRLSQRVRKPSKSTSAAGSLPTIPKLFAPKPRKLLVIDLDETLVHTMTHGLHRNCEIVEVQRPDSTMASFYYVAKRPFCVDFLSTVMQWYDLAIFTASLSEYADPIIDLLEHDVGKPVFQRRLYRDSCTASYMGGYIKDLTVLNEDLGRVILLDNSPLSYSYQLGNGLAIEGWISDPSDHALLQLLPLLFALQHTTDVRSILSLHNSKLLLMP